MERKLQRIYDILQFIEVQDLSQVHYQMLPINFPKKFIELNVNLDTMIKNVKHVELNISIAIVFLNTQILKII